MISPLISIIITVLNGEETIRRCLYSIQNQKFSNYELVIVDGGSEDRTTQIIEEVSISRKVVKVVSGIGLYAGLNSGIGLSSGKWLYFMGADDELYDSDTLAVVSQKIREGDSDTMVFVGSVTCVKQKTLLRPLFGSPYLMRHQVHHQGMFYKRSIFDKSLYDESMRIASDYEFNLLLALNGVKHQSMDIIVCNFGGDGVSERQLKHGYTEMQRIHGRIFTGLGREWAMIYFWLRRRVGALLRYYNMPKFNVMIKKVFG